MDKVHLHILNDLHTQNLKFNQLSGTKQKAAFELEKAGLAEIQPLKNMSDDYTANYVVLTDLGRKGFQTCIDQLNIFAEAHKE